jgi:hypothetical protein
MTRLLRVCCYEWYNVTSVIQNPTPYYEMEYSSTDNIITYFPYWCSYTRRCDDIHNCGVHQYARPLMNGRWKFHVPYMPFFAKQNLNWSICFYVVLFNRIKTIYFNYLQFSHCELSISTCIWSKYISVDTIFQSLWFLSEFPW